MLPRWCMYQILVSVFASQGFLFARMQDVVIISSLFVKIEDMVFWTVCHDT